MTQEEPVGDAGGARFHESPNLLEVLNQPRERGRVSSPPFRPSMPPLVNRHRAVACLANQVCDFIPKPGVRRQAVHEEERGPRASPTHERMKGQV